MADLLKAISGCQLPEKQKLQGSKNWNTWKSSIRIYFQLLDIEPYFEDEITYKSIPTIQKTQALLIIRQNLTEEPLSLIFDKTDPFDALSTLSASYQGTGPVLRQQLYLEFHGIRFEYYNSLNEFISAFKGYISKLSNVGAKIDDIDQKTIFIAALAASYPIWADRQRSALRTTSPPTLDSLINDILDENRRSSDIQMGNSFYTNKHPRYSNNRSNKRDHDQASSAYNRNRYNTQNYNDSSESKPNYRQTSEFRPNYRQNHDSKPNYRQNNDSKPKFRHNRDSKPNRRPNSKESDHEERSNAESFYSFKDNPTTRYNTIPNEW
jgi:hypothetical protein